ncbi:hypothetical protein DFH07DRAFT_767228 [Mycena maculata]|uniref:Uncharacterized protein n=1 Tax=Mycena maculata TaxID=230809 RepID=A0AAD7JYB9_9AGAR|nr:hypothetical protein DFH07DRAFT_767228 [Mycena maculata]
MKTGGRADTPLMRSWLEHYGAAPAPTTPQKRGPGYHQRRCAELMAHVAARKSRVTALMDLRRHCVEKSAHRWPLPSCHLNHQENQKSKAFKENQKLNEIKLREKQVEEEEREAAEARVAFLVGWPPTLNRSEPVKMDRYLIDAPRISPLDVREWRAALLGMSNLKQLVVAKQVPFAVTWIAELPFVLDSFGSAGSLTGAWAEMLRQSDVKELSLNGELFAQLPTLPRLHTIKVRPADVARFAETHEVLDVWLWSGSPYSGEAILQETDLCRFAQSPARLHSICLGAKQILQLLAAAPALLTGLQHIALDKDEKWFLFGLGTRRLPAVLYKLGLALDGRFPDLKSLMLAAELSPGDLSCLLIADKGLVFSRILSRLCSAPLLRTFHFCAYDSCITLTKWGQVDEELHVADWAEHSELGVAPRGLRRADWDPRKQGARQPGSAHRARTCTLSFAARIAVQLFAGHLDPAQNDPLSIGFAFTPGSWRANRLPSPGGAARLRDYNDRGGGEDGRSLLRVRRRTVAVGAIDGDASATGGSREPACSGGVWMDCQCAAGTGLNRRHQMFSPLPETNQRSPRLNMEGHIEGREPLPQPRLKKKKWSLKRPALRPATAIPIPPQRLRKPLPPTDDLREMKAYFSDPVHEQEWQDAIAAFEKIRVPKVSRDGKGNNEGTSEALSCRRGPRRDRFRPSASLGKIGTLGRMQRRKGHTFRRRRKIVKTAEGFTQDVEFFSPAITVGMERGPLAEVFEVLVGGNEKRHRGRQEEGVKKDDGIGSE